VRPELLSKIRQVLHELRVCRADQLVEWTITMTDPEIIPPTDEPKRPAEFSDGIFQEVCDRMAGGEGLRKICEDPRCQAGRPFCAGSKRTPAGRLNPRGYCASGPPTSRPQAGTNRHLRDCNQARLVWFGRNETPRLSLMSTLLVNSGTVNRGPRPQLTFTG
jgi:hypothetical protein